MKVITILGLVGHTKAEQIIEDGKIRKVFVEKREEDKAIYTFGSRLKDIFALSPDKRYINTLPILCELFGCGNVIPVYTDKSRDIQRQVLQYEGIDQDIFTPEGHIADEKDFPAVFKIINDILDEQEGKIIIDITHGFRHLPILMTVSMIMENIKNIRKIKHIFFAKEQIPFQQYEIIELKEYLDIANISIVLSGFNKNYTLAHHISCVDEGYQRLIDLLSEFSEHILANSIITLIDADDSLVVRILKEIEIIEVRGVPGLENYLRPITFHLRTMKRIRDYPPHEKLYHLAKQLADKGYFLNAVTLLDEAIGHYCGLRFQQYDPAVAEHVDQYKRSVGKKLFEYKWTNASKNLVKKLDKADPYLKIPQPQEEKQTDEDWEKIKEDYRIKLENHQKFQARLREAGQRFYIVRNNNKQQQQDTPEKRARDEARAKTRDLIPYDWRSALTRAGLKVKIDEMTTVSDAARIKNLIVRRLKEKKGLEAFQTFIADTDDMRNNLAHANSSSPIKTVRDEMEVLIERYKYLCIDEDVLA